MAEIKDGGPAFPHRVRNGLAMMTADGPELLYDDAPGMSLRDWFAGQALMGGLANPAPLSLPYHDIAVACYCLADAMLTARESKP